MKQKIEKIIDIILEAGWLLIIFLIPVYFNFNRSYYVFDLGKIVLLRILLEVMLESFLFKILF